MTHATIVPSRRTSAYAMRVTLELLHEGQARQHSEHAALVKQHATCTKETDNLKVCRYSHSGMWP
jgi:hypothetical protein